MTEGGFEGRVAFITGAGQGFGRLFASALGARGAAIAVADIDEGAATKAAASLEEEGIEALGVVCDVAAEDHVADAMRQTVDRFGGVDILVNNAGKHLMKYKQPFSVLPRDEVRALFEVNLIGIINCSVEARVSMLERGGGVIVNIASIAGHMVTTPYGVSKLAVRGLTMALASEFARDGIRVNAISPGLMATESAMGDLPADMVEEFVQRRQLIHRLGQPEDLVGTLLHLCSDASSFVTGETLVVGGGHPLSI